MPLMPALAPLSRLAAYSRDTGAASLRLAGAAAQGSATVTRAVGGAVAGQGAAGLRGAASRLPGHPANLLGDIREVAVGHGVRRAWTRAGRAHIEVKGLTGRGETHRRVAADVTAALSRLRGVKWAKVNAVTREVLLAFDEEQIGIEEILAVIEAVEGDNGTGDADLAAGREAAGTPEHPADDEPIEVAALALATDLTGLGAAIAFRIADVAPLPRAARLPLLLADTYPPLRRGLEDRLGHQRAELLVALATSTVNAASLGPGPLAVDCAHHSLRLAERLGRRAVWRRREGELTGDGRGLAAQAPVREPRPAPLPDGPIEKLGDREAIASLIGAGGVLAFTRDPGRAAELMLATMPKAGRQGREAFAAVLGLCLAGHGVLPLDGTALRRLDRVDTVVIDATVLCGGPPTVLDARGEAGFEDEEVRLIAERLLADGPPESASEWRDEHWRLQPRTREPDRGIAEALELDLIDVEDVRRGVVQVGRGLDPHAEAVLAAAHEAADRVLVTQNTNIEPLLPWVDDVLPGDGGLCWHIRDLQREGHGVLLVACADDAALAGADVSVAVPCPRPGSCAAAVGWAADFIAGPGLVEVWRLLHAVPAARAVTRTSTRFAWAGGSLGALIAVSGDRRSRRTPRLSPVHGAATLAVLGGAYHGLRVGRERAPRPTDHTAWHALSADEAFKRLRERRAEQRRREALSRPPVALRLARGAGRRLAATPPVRHVVIDPVRGLASFGGAVVEELRDPLTPVLALGAAASAVVGSSVDAALVTGVMGGNAVISAGQRLRARRAMRGLLLGERRRARLTRWPVPEGKASTRTVTADQLRPGDVIALRAGDIVPADGRLLSADGLEMDESALTGESLPVAKSLDATPGADLPERACMVYEGCTVLAGTAYAVVTAVGPDTEAGRAAAVAGASSPSRAGIQARLTELTRIALPATGIGGVAVTALAAARGVPFRRALASGVAIAVAAVPEGLPLVATVAQLGAARRLSRHGVLVRSASTLEALGRVDTLCFDKTGTLTEGRLSVNRSAAFDRDFAPDDERGRRFLRDAARACPDADVHATDSAIVKAAREIEDPESESWVPVADLPFESNRGYSAALGDRDGSRTLIVKGAPEGLLERCVSVATDDGTSPLNAARRRTAADTLKRLADDGLRVLAVAERAVPEAAATREGLPGLVGELTLLGFVALADTPRAGAGETVERLTAAGVRPVMITGDHPRTAVAVARGLGIPDADRVLTGAELDRLSKAGRDRRIAETTVFARVSPQHKVRIVQALQSTGRVVAMAGDGSNDAAAIRAADVGIALAGTGSVPARNAADLVLTEPEPLRLLDAIEEGRALWRRVRAAVGILVGGNAGEIAFTVLGTAIGGQAPLGTRQFLLVNMMTDMLPALAVALAPERPQDGERADAPVGRVWGPELGRDLAVRGGATALGALLAWQAGRTVGRERRASTMALAALVGTQLGQTLLAGRRSPLVAATCLGSAVALVAVVETPGVSRFFGCTPLGPVAWGIVGASCATATLAGAAAPGLVEKIAASRAPTHAED
ncbi:cation-translocating P-type ATPase [Actinospica sp. MGRD01-02]|uniref:Cation-translocating P-type ATPase n=1 Tax=Actinospica acidithermotolerans TaxID=2828514 RepID=A0A941EF06_9ACTN|nr:cation-translocating P-type ATPase [Actinospica acidithermotolerans]MBR7829282.1 cation-translocating P-type ATPase [Actinospica acidithermotolerans]